MIQWVKSNNKLATIALRYHGNVLHETPGFRGVSHLCEHLKMRWLLDEHEKYDRCGMHFNAMTGTRDVFFYLSGLSRYMKHFEAEFLERVIHARPTKEEFERERKVVLAEYGNAMTSLAGVYRINFLRKKYGFCGPIGYREDLEKLTYEAFLSFLEKEFSAPDELLRISRENGGSTIPFAEKRTAKLAKPSGKTLNLEPYQDCAKQEVLHFHAEVPLEDLPRAFFAAQLLSDLGPLFKVLRQEHSLVYGVGASAGKISDDRAIFDISGLLDQKNLRQAQALTQEILAHPEKHITHKRFNDTLFSTKIQFELDDMNRAENFRYYLTPEEERLPRWIKQGLLPYDSVMHTLKSLRFETSCFAEL